MQKRDARLAAGAEIAAEAELHAGKEAVPDVAAQILPARGGDGGIRREEADERLGDKLDEDDDRDAERAGDHRGVAQRETRALGLARADILRAERRDGREHRRRDEEEEADDLFDDADGGRVRQAAAVGDDRDDDERDLNKAVLQSDGHADLKELTHDGALRAKVRAADGDEPALQDDRERDEDAHRLRERGAERRARGAEVQRAHEVVVERDVDDAGDGDEVHGALAVTKAAEDRGDDVVRRDERNTDKADREIGERALHGLLRCGHDGDDTPAQREQQCRQRKRQQHEERDRVADGRGGALFVAAAGGLRDADRRAHRKADEHDCEHVHHLRADGDGGRAGDALKLADDEEVGHAVERLQKVREQIRQRKGHNVAKDAAGGEIVLHRKGLLISIAWSHHKLYNNCRVKRRFFRAEKSLTFPDSPVRRKASAPRRRPRARRARTRPSARSGTSPVR